jgi:predicted dehydrogenase
MGAIHAKAYSQLASSRLVAIVDIDLQKAAELAKTYGCQAFGDCKQILDQVDAVTIATPTPTHLELASMFITREIPVLIEKPIAADIRQARRIVELSERYQTLVAVGHSERYNPAVLAMRPHLARHRFIEAIRVSPFPFRSTEVSVVLDVMIHDIDLVLSMVCSPLKQVQAVGVGVVTDNQDLCSARMAFANGCVANLTASRLALKKERRIRVFTDDVYMSVDCLARKGTLIRLRQKAGQIDQLRQGILEGKIQDNLDWANLVQLERLQIGDGEPVLLQHEAFRDAVARRPGLPIVTAQEGLAALRCAKRIIDQVARHRWS